MGIVGIITNKPLAKLWDFMASYNCKSEVNSSDALKAFQECDAALTELEKDRDHWKTMYGNACGDQDVLKESIRLLDTANKRLEQKVRDQENEIKQRRKEVDCLYKELDQLQEENEKLRKGNDVLECVIERNVNDSIVNMKTTNQLRKDNEKLYHMLQDLQREYDKLKNDRDRKAEAVVELAKKRDELQEEYNKLLNSSGYFRNSRDTWSSRAKHAEAEAVELAKKCDKLLDENEDLKKKLAEANDILEETNRDRNEWRRRALMTKLTSKLPDIKEEYTMTVTMDNADYNDLMKLLWNKSFGASPEYMRDFLKAFCEDHDSCRVCPLKECCSDLGSSFDSMSDEEIEKYYKIAIRCNT